MYNMGDFIFHYKRVKDDNFWFGLKTKVYEENNFQENFLNKNIPYFMFINTYVKYIFWQILNKQYDYKGVTTPLKSLQLIYAVCQIIL